MDLSDRLQILADLVATLEAPDADFGHWESGSSGTDGVLQLPWFALGPAGDDVRAAVGRGRLTRIARRAAVLLAERRP